MSLYDDRLSLVAEVRRRDPEKVAWDVLNDYVSREAAERYGAVVREDGTVDEEATAKLRASGQSGQS